MRYHFIDSVRGIVLVSMILYHTAWDLVYLFQADWDWYRGESGYIWQQSICWTFIFLSGFCWDLGKHPAKRGLIVLTAGALVSLATWIAMPRQSIMFGILTFLGISMLLLIPLSRLLRKIPPAAGIAASSLLFAAARNINDGYLGFEQWNLCQIPERLYDGMFATFLGFRDPAFHSSDYFSLFPWFFLFLAGYFVYKEIKERELHPKLLEKKIPFFSALGRCSLQIYLIHQPIIYIILRIFL